MNKDIQAIREVLRSLQYTNVGAHERRNVTKALGHLNALEEQYSWKPIESAPDGHMILAYAKDWIVLSPAYRNGSFWFDEHGDPIKHNPTHYMPLPTTEGIDDEWCNNKI